MVNEKMISNLSSQLLAVDQLLQAIGHAVVRGQRVNSLQFGQVEDCAIAIQRQWALPFSIDTQDPQLLAVTGHVGGARGVHMQTIRGGVALFAAVSKVIAVFCRGEKLTESDCFETLFAEKESIKKLFKFM